MWFVFQEPSNNGKPLASVWWASTKSWVACQKPQHPQGEIYGCARPTPLLEFWSSPLEIAYWISKIDSELLRVATRWLSSYLATNEKGPLFTISSNTGIAAEILPASPVCMWVFAKKAFAAQLVALPTSACVAGSAAAAAEKSAMIWSQIWPPLATLELSTSFTS